MFTVQRPVLSFYAIDYLLFFLHQKRLPPLFVNHQLMLTILVFCTTTTSIHCVSQTNVVVSDPTSIHCVSRTNVVVRDPTSIHCVSQTNVVVSDLSGRMNNYNDDKQTVSLQCVHVHVSLGTASSGTSSHRTYTRVCTTINTSQISVVQKDGDPKTGRCPRDISLE